MKRQRITTQMKEQTRNTEVQTNEEEIRQTPWKMFQNNDSKDDKKKNLENKIEKMQESIISSSVVLISSCPQSLPGSESFPMSQLFA